MTLLITEVLAGFLQVHYAGRGMTFVPAPETTAWVSFPESRMYLKHLFCTVGFKHTLSILHRVSFWDVHLEMNMVPGEPKVTELEPKAF